MGTRGEYYYEPCADNTFTCNFAAFLGQIRRPGFWGENEKFTAKKYICKKGMTIFLYGEPEMLHFVKTSMFQNFKMFKNFKMFQNQ